jgi:hypothetical protein
VFLQRSFLTVRGRFLCELWRYNAKSKHDQNCAQNDSMFLQGGLSFLSAVARRGSNIKERGLSVECVLPGKRCNRKLEVLVRDLSDYAHDKSGLSKPECPNEPFDSE